MDFYRFINSLDIREYHKQIKYPKRLVWPNEDPEFGEEYEKISEKGLIMKGNLKNT